MKQFFNKENIITILVRFAIYISVMGIIIGGQSYYKYFHNNNDKQEIIIRDIDSCNWRDGEFTLIDPACVVNTFSRKEKNTMSGSKEYEIRLVPQKSGVFFVLMNYKDYELEFRWDLYRVEVYDDLDYKVEVKKDLTEPCRVSYGVPCSKALSSLKGRSYIDDIPEDLSLMKPKKYLCNDGNTRTVYFSDEGYLYSMDFDLSILKQCMRVETTSGTDENNLCYKFVPDEWCGPLSRFRTN